MSGRRHTTTTLATSILQIQCRWGQLQIIINTDFERQQEVVQITITIGHPEGWDSEATPLPTKQVRDVLEKL